MGKVVALLAAFVFTLSLAGFAMAQETQKAPGADAPKAAPSSDPAKSDTGKSPETKPAPAARDMGKPAASKPAAGGDFRGRHSMRGEVTKLDTAKGMMTVKTDEGDLNLHVPPAALGGIKEGDRVEVQLAIRPAAGGAPKSDTGKAPGASKTNDASKPGAKPGMGGQGSSAPGAPKTQ